MSDQSLIPNQVSFLTVDANHVGQRIDNFLIANIKGVPKTLFYRLLREGQIRVNKKRTKPVYRMLMGDIVRLPPLRFMLKEKVDPNEELKTFLLARLLYEDEHLLILNKPSGMSVHAGSNQSFGVVEAMQSIKPEYQHLQLAHRLDRDTSGCLVFAKNRQILQEIQDLFRAHLVKKVYLALTKGQWKKSEYHVTLPLLKKELGASKELVRVDPQGKSAVTDFLPLHQYKEATLTQVTLQTGRTHQIRVHAAYYKHPVAGDDKYGDRVFNKQLQQVGLRRLFLHAERIEFTVESIAKKISCVAPLDDSLQVVISKLSPLSLMGEGKGEGL